MTSLTCALGPDAAGTLLSRLLRDARARIEAAIYEVGPSYRWELVRAARRGVPVRLVLDAHASDGNAATARELIAAGSECRVAGGQGHAAHGKLLLIDETVAVGTGNLIWRDAPRDRRLRFPPAAVPLAGTREWWATATGSGTLERDVRRAFDTHWDTARRPPEDWSNRAVATVPVVGTPIPQVAPFITSLTARRLRLITGGAAVGAALQALVSTARRLALVTIPYVHPVEPPVRHLLDLMVDASARGVHCALLLGAVPRDPDARVLARLPFEVRRMDPARSTSGHAKGAVIDGSALVSSANWSSAGLGANWETALHIEHPGAAAYYAGAWRRDWETGVGLDV
ncbi:MAG TPA: phospholipase D-like domain-containing protein [Candidatus Saccharimonadales bacterium]|nr:phospholipase D-like domain-containing protein [Candidatus Saccharimonadales bacterium]